MSNKMNLCITLENEHSGKLDEACVQVVDEDEITQKVIDVIEKTRWTLRPGDSIKIAEIA